MGQSGQRYDIGLYHGDLSGHLLVHCNFKILLIDFSVKEPRNYSFFIEDELCELSIVRNGERFGYGLEINTWTDTPLNKARKVQNRKYWLQTLAFFGGLLLLIGSFIFAISYFFNGYQNRKSSALLDENGISAVARFEVDDSVRLLTYQFVAGGTTYQHQKPIEKTAADFRDFFSVQTGDEFEILYLPGRPEINRILFEKPSPRTLDRLQFLVLQKHLQSNREMSENIAKCWLSVAYDLIGIPGWADFYAQDILPEANPYHNRQTYLRLIRDIPFLKATREKCHE